MNVYEWVFRHCIPAWWIRCNVHLLNALYLWVAGRALDKAGYFDAQ